MVKHTIQKVVSNYQCQTTFGAPHSSITVVSGRTKTKSNSKKSIGRELKLDYAIKSKTKMRRYKNQGVESNSDNAQINT